MGAQMLREQQAETLTNIPAEGVQDLIRRLANNMVKSTPPSVRREQSDDVREVILDVEVDGARYLLVRSPSKSPRTQVLLSPREQEIARMVAKGYANKTIAAVLDISCWTVGTHLRRIFAKLGVGSRAAMVAQLLQEDLIQQQPGETETPVVRRG
jgi:two-component system nitrate/nitrite response regulator NarL